MTVELEYKVEGMTCSNCVRHVIRAFEELDGDGKPMVVVFLDESRATAKWPKTAPDFALIHETLQEAGYQVSTLEDPRGKAASLAIGESEEARAIADEPSSKAAEVALLISVSGMTCASCVAHVEKALGKVEGTADATVNLATASARVMIPAKLDPQVIYKAIEDAGYSAGPLRQIGQSDESQPKPWLAFTLAAVPVSVMVLAPIVSPDPAALLWVQLIACSIALVTAGREILMGGGKALLSFRPDMNSLVALGLLAAYFYSVGIFFQQEPGAGSLMFKEASMLLLFILFGRALEHGARRSAFGSLSQLLSEEPKTARKVVDSEITEVPTSELRRGDRVLIERGSRAPVDGLIIEGTSAFNESLITGESLPVQRAVGELVLAGSINAESPVTIEVTRAGEDSTLRQLVALVSTAQAEKAPIQRFVDKIAAVFVPIVLGIAIITFLSWFFLTGSLALALSHFVAVLVVACPCALGLATPTALVVGSSVALRHGILVKSAPILEALSSLSLIAFDKTGTLTEGHPKVQATVGDKECLPPAAALAALSQHPLSKAIAGLATESKATLRGSKEQSGKGVTAVDSEDRLHVLGARELLEENGFSIDPDLITGVAEEESYGSTLVWYGSGQKARLVFALRDGERPEAKELISQLKASGLRCHLLTGDHEKAAQLVARQVGISDWKSKLRPEQKLEELDRLKREVAPGLLAMVGDGINDAPALARADIGISLASGTDVAREAGDIVLLKSGLEGLKYALDISRATLRKVRQNLLWATAYNLAGIPLAAGLFSPLGVELPPSFAGLAMALSSVSVVANSLLLNRFQSRP
jgi:P-type Cu+ transporter